MVIDLEYAKDYFLIPLADKEDSLMWIGDKYMMDHLANIMVKEDLISHAGVLPDRCYLFVNWTQDQANKMIAQAKQMLKQTKAIYANNNTKSNVVESDSVVGKVIDTGEKIYNIDDLPTDDD